MKSRRLYLILGLSVLYLIPLAIGATSHMRAIVYIISCPTCSEISENDPSTPYLRDLKAAFNKIGITDIEAWYLGPGQTDELDVLYQNFGVPTSMRGMQVVVDIDEKFLFVNFVPVEFITEFLTKYSERYRSLVVYRDLSRELYVVMDEAGHIEECNIKNSIAECVGDQGLFSSSVGSVLPLVIISGLLDSINPCAFSILLFFIAFVFTMSEVSVEKSRRRVLMVGSFYIIGLFLAYVMIGLGLMAVVSIVPFPHLVGMIAALLLVLLGAINLKEYFFQGRGFGLGISNSNMERIKNWMNKLTTGSAFIAGSLVGIFGFPCTGGIYFATIGMLAQRTTFLQGFTYLLVYNVAFVLPLIALCVFASQKFYYKEILEFLSLKCPLSIRKRLRLIWGSAMVALGVFLLLYSFV